MKQLCKTCPEQKYCTEACLESLAAEHEDNSKNYSKIKYVKKPTNATGFGIYHNGANTNG